MKLLKKILELFKKEEKIKEKVEEKPEKIVLSSTPLVPEFLQTQNQVIVEDEGVDIDEDNNE
tara:strand:- start:390 stop:575 length:186 start_codon:yes stop_codon:yes gene_type:complete